MNPTLFADSKFGNSNENQKNPSAEMHVKEVEFLGLNGCFN